VKNFGGKKEDGEWVDFVEVEVKDKTIQIPKVDPLTNQTNYT
jgi:DNA relaxase NicK